MSPSSPVELDPSVAFLKGPVTELENYRVLGVVDKVMLVLDRKTERTYIIKVCALYHCETEISIEENRYV